MRARDLVLFVAALAVLAATSGCRLLTQEVACRRDGDCPLDVGLAFCSVSGDTDAGVGVCVEEDPFPADPNDDDDGGFALFPDGGPADGG